MIRQGPGRVYFVKAVRVFVSGLLSISIPFYLRALGYGPFFQGLALVAIVAGNALSNVTVTYLDSAVGRRRLLQAFSLLMVVAGVILVVSPAAVPILGACLIGNISSTGTEAGPFQSIEAGALPDLAGSGTSVKVFGRYNMIGYSAAALGQLAASGPGFLGDRVFAFHAALAGFALAGAILFVTYSGLHGLERSRATRPGFANLTPQGKKDLVRLSGLFSVDAFGGVFATTYLLSIWFNSTYGLTLAALGLVFFVATLISAASTYGSAFIAVRVGNLRTMVYTHMASNAFLILMGAAGSLTLALAFLFLRQSLSQMDVPTRQALMTEMFQKEERVQAYAVTNTVRSAGTFFASPVSAAMLGAGLVGGLPFAGGAAKVAYDLMAFVTYRKRYR